ncbi:hypothetical protein TB2_022635 [Malus domestica]
MLLQYHNFHFRPINLVEGLESNSIVDVIVLAVKGGRVNDFNGKVMGTISTSQLLIEPNIEKAYEVRNWFEKEGNNTPCIFISRETTGVGRADIRKTLSQIKDEKLGTFEKLDWITVGARISFLKVKEEIFSDEQHVKSTVIKAEKVNFSSEAGVHFTIDR